MQLNEPTNWPRERHPRVVPAHGLFKLDALNQPRQSFGQHFGSEVPLLFDDSEDIFTAILLADLEVLGINAIFLRKTQRGRQCNSIFIKSLICRRPFDEVFAVGLIWGKGIYRNDQPPRGRKDADIAMSEIQFIEQGDR